MAQAKFRRQMTFGGRMHPEVGMLIALTALVSLAAAIGDRNGMHLSELLVFVPDLVLHGEVWRLVTAVFIEHDPISLIFSCLMIYWFGRDLASVWGPRRFLILYFSMAALIYSLVGLTALAFPSLREVPYSGNWPLAEAMVIAWALYFPDRQIRLYFIIPVAGRMLIYFTIGVVILMAAFSGITHFLPHLYAQAITLLYLTVLQKGRYSKKLRNWLNRAQRTARTRTGHLKSVGRDQKPGSDPENKPPHYWN